MIGEREDFQQETDYGTLVMRSYDIDGNDIKAFYDSSDDLIFVLDNTVNEAKPNVLLVINPDGDKKWDEILSSEYGVDLETIRPKQDNKYQKLDIEYSGLGVYDNLINAYNAGESLEENLNQLAILRDSAARHSAMVRLNAANEMIAKTNMTIVKTKESIVRLQERLKNLRAKLIATKKEIGKVSTKQSAAKILKIESQIEAVTEKLNRAKSRLNSAQRRLEIATVDAELASDLLNRQPLENKNTKKVKNMPESKEHETKAFSPIETEYEENNSVSEDTEESVKKDDKLRVPDEEESNMLVPLLEDEENDELEKQDSTLKVAETTDEEETDEEETEVKPLFDEEPQIMDEKIAFKPVLLDKAEDTEDVSLLPTVNVETQRTDPTEREEQMPNENLENKPVLESMTPVEHTVESVTETEEQDVVTEEPKPVIDMMKPIDEPQEAQEQQEQKNVVDIITPVEDIPLPSESQEQETNLQVEVEKEENLVQPQEPVSFAPVEIEKSVEETVVEQQTEEPMVRQPVMEETERPRPVSPQLSNGVAAPVYNNASAGNYSESKSRKPSMLYYILLILLIVLSVFTLWLYQKNVEPTTPELTTTASETTSVLKPKAKKTTKAPEPVETIFLDEEPEQKPVEEEQEEVESVIEEPEPEPEETPEEETPEDVVPVVEDAVPAHLTTSGMAADEEETGLTEEEILARKPVYEPGGKDIGMLTEETEEDVGFVDEQPEETVDEDVPQDEYQENPDEEMIVDPDSLEYDEEEAQYQAEQASMEYEE